MYARSVDVTKNACCPALILNKVAAMLIAVGGATPVTATVVIVVAAPPDNTRNGAALLATSESYIKSPAESSVSGGSLPRTRRPPVFYIR